MTGVVFAPLLSLAAPSQGSLPSNGRLWGLGFRGRSPAENSAVDQSSRAQSSGSLPLTSLHAAKKIRPMRMPRIDAQRCGFAKKHRHHEMDHVCYQMGRLVNAAAPSCSRTMQSPLRRGVPVSGLPASVASLGNPRSEPDTIAWISASRRSWAAAARILPASIRL